ncbi:MAG: recombinase family protein [Pseudomonadota bacterium]
MFDDLKRASRDTRAFLNLRDAFRDREAQVQCLNFQLDDSPEGEFLERLFAAQGQLERKQNGRRVAQKMRARMESGFWIHNAPVGYRYEKRHGRGRVLVPDQPFAAIVKEALEGFASGRFQTQAEVKRFLEGFPDFPHLKNGELKQQRVTDILTHPICTGHICFENYDLH